MRIHLFEFGDFSWFPELIRSGGTDYLRYFLLRTKLYDPVVPLIGKVLKLTGDKQIIDLCSGGGGCIEIIYNQLNKTENETYQIILTDKFPNVNAFEFFRQKSGGKIDYIKDAVDVFKIPDEIKGLRVMFSAIHHFKPAEVKEILQNNVYSKRAICIFDGGEKNLFAIAGLIVVHTIALVLFTPFFRPFRFSRLFFTYLIPLIPLYTIWDGVVSILRMYTPKDFQSIVNSLNNDGYHWEWGKTRNRFGIKATYLIGYPKK